MAVAMVQWLTKSANEALATPFTYLVVTFLKRWEHLDGYDRHTDFNPMRLD